MSGPISVPTYHYSSCILSETGNNKESNNESNKESNKESYAINGLASRPASEVQTKSGKSTGKTSGISTRKCEVIEEPETLVSWARRFVSTISAVLCTPLRIGTTLLNVGIFTGYYVTVMTMTGIGALTGALTGIASKIKACIASSPAKKSLKEYTVSLAQKVFKWLTLPYENLPEKFKGSVFPVMTGAALFVFETAAIPGKRIPLEVYKKVCAKVYAATSPYKPVTDMTVRLFEATKCFISGLIKRAYQLS